MIVCENLKYEMTIIYDHLYMKIGEGIKLNLSSSPILL